MTSKMQVPELKCMEPENYRKYFRSLCWSGTRKNGKKPNKKIGKKEKLRRLRAASALTVCYAPVLLNNPSQFAVYAAVRKSILARWKHLQPSTIEISDESDIDEDDLIPFTKLPKITGIGLRTVFALIAQARQADSEFCGYALKALLDVLQGHTPEELSQEPTEIVANLHSMLVEVSGGGTPASHDPPTILTALSSSCLLALCVARGESELILSAVTSLIMSSAALSEQYVPIPTNLTTLQRSVQSVILGAPSRNQWLNHGVPHQSLVTSFPVDLPAQITSGTGDLVVRSLVSDGCFLYVFTSKGLLKIGSGYGSSIRQHVYLYKADFFASDRHGWLGYCKNKLYVRIGRKKTEVYEVDKDNLEVKNVIKLDPGLPSPFEGKSAVFTDGNQLGLVLLTNFDTLTIRMFDVDCVTDRQDGTISLAVRKDLNVHLLRRKTLALGKAPFEDVLARRSVELDAPVAMQLDDNDDDPLVSISAGQDFALLTTASGRVYYTGKTTSLGYKSPTTHTSQWILMKESVYARNDLPNLKKCRVIQVAVGHEGLHAILVLDSGTALFTGIARRGEDGDSNKHRRTPKPTRPKKIYKADGHHIVYAACNYGSTALVTRQGLLFMFGKDTQHCDSSGLVLGLKHERVTQVALGKAHAVALTSFGQVYTFGINNKGQCGRDFGVTKDKVSTSRRNSISKEEPQICQTHTWSTDETRRCALCSPSDGELRNQSEPELKELCEVCNICRRCANTNVARAERSDNDDDGDSSSKNEGVSTSEPGGAAAQEGSGGSSHMTAVGRVPVPGGHRVTAVAAGLHHTVLLTEHGEVLTCGSNQYGQLGVGDIAVHQRIVRVQVPNAVSIAAGSNHTAILTAEGELYTFGCCLKGALGRPRTEEPEPAEHSELSERSAVWYAVPGRVPRLGASCTCQAVWVSASGDQTFVQLSQAIIKTDTLFSSTITADSNSIVILPNRPEHLFKCITINKSDGSCNAWTGSEQVDFVNSLACLDPLYDVLWCYQPQMRVMKCYNILAYDSHNINKCCTADTGSYTAESEFEYPNHGIMKRLEEFRNLENFEVVSDKDERQTDNMALSNMSILNQELAIPAINGCSVTRMHAALHLLGCLDSLTFAHDNKIYTCDNKVGNISPAVSPAKEDLLTVNRFESHGGGWGYSGHSVEAIRFMCDTDIMLGGYGLFGGRGDYTARIKLFDLGVDGGEQEGDGELIAETDEVVYECAPRDRFPMLFESSIPIVSNRWYVAWACINGPSSDCGSSGQAMVINDEIGFHFKTSKKSNNGTDVNAGQIPCLLYNIMTPDHMMPTRYIDFGEPVVALTKNLSRKVTVKCFKSLLTLLNWSWKTFIDNVLETNGQIPINYHKLTTMKHQKRLVYVIRASLRLTKSYINEIYPLNNRKRNSQEYNSYSAAIGEVRNLIQTILAAPTPTCSMLQKLPGKSKVHKACYVQFALEMTNSVLKEANETIISCFHAFFPSPMLKWNHLCSLLHNVKDGIMPTNQIRELSATATAVSTAKSLRDVLQYAVPVTQNYLSSTDSRPFVPKVIKEVASKSATVPRSSHAQKPPPVPPRANREQKQPPEPQEAKSSYRDWHLLDVIPRLLDIVLEPIRDNMTLVSQCGVPHDHGEMKQNDNLTDACCRLCARIVHDLFHTTANLREDLETNTVKHLITPSRFMRVNQTRAWNTGNGSPDAICFTVDRAGVMLVGACVFGGLGNSEYSLELLHDVRQIDGGNGEGPEPSHCWANIESVHGVFAAVDCQHEMAQIKFNKPIPLKEEHRYALRLCNHGGRTANGDCGLPSVKGPDGTTFKFASCSLSFNGTSLARGQIPCLIYYGTSKSFSNSAESADTLISTLRSVTLRVASVIIDRSAELLSDLRNKLTPDDLRRNAYVLQNSPAINILIPFTLASLEGLEDAKSVIELLEMIHKLVGHVAALNLLCPSTEDTSTTTTHYNTWVESDHPYKPSTVSNMRVLFPPSVSWIVLEMDPRSITAQPEDSLTVFAVAGMPKHKPCQCYTDAKSTDPPFRKRFIQLNSSCSQVQEMGEEAENETPCAHYTCTYVSVTSKLSNVSSEWPQKALLVPGNEVIFSLETASDYLNEYNKPNSIEDNHFGFRCLCVGYEDAMFTTQRQGLLALEMELIHAGAACASKLLAPDLDMPPLCLSTLMDIQMPATSDGSPAEGCEQDASEALLLSRGLELSSPPSIHHVLDGQPLLRSVSTERQFLSDFVAGAESTAGGRLARWLAPIPCVEPERCELRKPTTPPRPDTRVTLPLLIRDQYGDVVLCPTVKVEVVVQQQLAVVSHTLEARCGNLPAVRYHTTVRDNMCFHAITMMKAYQQHSFEELRYYSGVWGEATTATVSTTGRVPAERLPVKAQPDGSYAALWTPKAPGEYVFRCSLDYIASPQELTIHVAEAPYEGPSERGVQAGGSLQPSPPSKVRRFTGAYSAGLRVRASPSLQAEELGRVPSGGMVGFVEEVTNKDGTWVRLSCESIRAYTEGCTSVAWCMQYHRELNRMLLELIDTKPNSPTHSEAAEEWPTIQAEEGPSDVKSARPEDDADDLCMDDKRFPFSIQIDMPTESEVARSEPDASAPECSQRGRLLRNNPSTSSPRRMHRRNNGNSEEWWSPIRHRSLDAEPQVIPEVELDAAVVLRPVSRLAETGTQTSPQITEAAGPSPFAIPKASNEGRRSPKLLVREHVAMTSGAYKRSVSPPPVPARQIKKQAISPAQAECLRAVFAALLWHEGIVHDAIACAAFLKFHPNLPKQGARVVTRPALRDTNHTRNQRHSVEVATAGQYLHIQASTLEALTRSGMEASASRARKADIAGPIQEEHDADTPSVVNVLPPALRALVTLWDTLYEARQLSVATERNKKCPLENNENEEKPSTGMRKKPDWRTDAGKTHYSVRCELCGNVNVTPPVAAHMRNVHLGCRVLASQGYDRVGVYVNVPPPPRHCGQLAQAPYQLWFMFCEECREKCITSAATVNPTKSIPVVVPEREEQEVDLDHITLKDNAVFLLDLAPLINSESASSTPPWERPREPLSRPLGSWQPAPPLQVLEALGAAPRAAHDPPTYHSLRRPTTDTSNSQAQMPVVKYEWESPPPSQWGRVPRSVSMGQQLGLFRQVNPEPQETIPGTGSSLLAQPSAALQKLVNCTHWTEVCSASVLEQPQIDVEALMKGSVMTFVLAKRDLHEFRQKMDAAVRINTVRQFAFEALNWLLRSSTQPTCVHDVMWWFCTALDKYSRIWPAPPTDDNKEGGENPRVLAVTPSTSAICPGGRAARGSRAALHAFLGSVSALAPSLPPASPANLQAVRCWALNYSQQDRAFLHRSQVFSVISKILSQSEDTAYEEGMMGTLHESFHSYLNKESYIWTCPDITSWCDVSVSSRQGMAGALTDNSTETFWESGDEDRNKAKWIQVTYPGGPPEDRPYILCIHIDNTRDTVNKTLLLTFLYSGGTSELYHMMDLEVDPKNASWICYTLPRSSGGGMRVRTELRGPEAAVRVRQVRVLSAPAPEPMLHSPALHATCEADTLRVFRLLTTQVFGKLLEWEGAGSECGEEGREEVALPDESDLREHVVGILFAGHKLTTLQKQVMSHIVTAIGCEAARVRDDWETVLLCADLAERDDDGAKPARQQDNYCFEMLSLLLALSGSSPGRAHLAQRTELLTDLLSLLHTGSERVQRQVILLLRRMITEVPPEKMLAALNYGQENPNNRVTLLDHLIVYLAKAITVQVKVKGAGGGSPSSLTMGAAITLGTEGVSWFMRGETTKEHANLVAKLLCDMADSKLSPAWGCETRSCLAWCVSSVGRVPDALRVPAACMARATVWMCLAALCVCDQDHIDLMNSASWSARSSSVRLCSNHDDGATWAAVACASCGPLCSECDRVLHLPRSARRHRRQMCKEEETAIRVDIHEGCGRAKLFWLLLLVDRRTLKALAEFRVLDDVLCEAGASVSGVGVGAGAGAALAGVCRFCGVRGNTGLLAIGNVCADHQCQELGKESCTRVLACGHACGGVRGERSCLPCLHGCAGADTALKQDADDMCMICFTDPLQAAPAIQLCCGHVFHLHCCKKVLANKWNGPRITFSFAQCPICKEDINHCTLEELLTPIRKLREEVRKKALMRLEYEGLAVSGETHARVHADPATYAMEKYAYYVCHKCEKAYFGGMARCEVESTSSWDPCELVCGACSDVTRAMTCPKHGGDFLEYKCRYCCSVAVFFCFGTSHFCNACHDDFQRVTNIPKHLLPQCPAGPKSTQLPGGPEQCPLHVVHPSTGEEFALGCGVCRHAHAF